MLNEAAWGDAVPVNDFTQKELVEGAEPSEKTVVRFLCDDDNFYVGVICYDSNPEGIVHRELKLDGLLYRIEDNFTIVIDTYNDKRQGYYFAVNANGSRYDGTFQTYVSPNIEWNGIWDVASRITDEGWSCEMVIPFKTLRFPNILKQTWGINFRRQIVRKNEEIMWRAWKHDDDILHLSKGGTITIDRALKTGRQLDVKPYILTGAEKSAGKDIDDTFKYGVDVRYGINSNTTLTLTTNTDFAQIESDREVINLTRYEENYPEQRDFFLENSELFTFSQGMTNVFYTRRIGLSPDRMSIPILGGAKLTQKTGSFNLGVMTMQTDEKYGIPSTNYSIMRMKKDIFKQSYIGLVATSKIESDGHDNQVYGGDMVLKTDSFLDDKTFEVQSYLVGSVTDGSKHGNLAGRVYVNYPNDLINAFFVYHAIGPNFNPEMGFINGKKPGVHQYMTTIDYKPRPDISFIKQFNFEPLYFNYYMDMNRKMIARYVKVRPFGFFTNANDEINIEIENRYEYVDEEFVIFDDIVIPVGGYDWFHTQFEIQSSESRPVFVDIETDLGDFFNGSRNQYNLELTGKPTMHFSISTDFRYNDISVGNRHFITREYGSRFQVDFSTRLTSMAFLQWNNETREVNVNLRFHYIPKIGSDIYLVYNHLMDEQQDFSTLQNTGMLKIDYIYRL
ncbi:MAG: carbohydrate binding family 9 domain-containing protein [Candidatus Latescibacteria bacterium]|nr:carbohydrate binding family 9 domain-containing protein [Candidatus Latescibacterota bacterium]